MPSTSRIHAGICARACVCQSFIAGLTLLTFPQTGVVSFFLFSLLFPLTTDNWMWGMASYADQTDMQAGSTMSPLQKWNSFSSRVNLFKESFYCDLKANIKLRAGKRDTSMPCALFHHGENVSLMLKSKCKRLLCNTWTYNPAVLLGHSRTIVAHITTK